MSKIDVILKEKHLIKIYDEELWESVKQELLSAILLTKPDPYSDEQKRFYENAPESYGLKKDSPDWYNLALSQWEQNITDLFTKEENE